MPDPAPPPPPPPPPLSKRTVIISAIVLGCVIVLFFLFGIIPRRIRERRLRERAHAAVLADSIPAVTVTRVERAQPDVDLVLPATIQGVQEAAIYARATGYIRRWYTDIGARVYAGELLAVIDAPDVDAQLMQARANQAQAEAALRIASVELKRWRILTRDSVATQEELDEHQSTYDADVASVGAAHANVRRLADLVQFEQVRAPFAGVITARNVDNGVFVTGGGGTNSAVPSALGGNTTTATSTDVAAGQSSGGASVGGAGGSGANSGGASGSLFRIVRTDSVRVYIGVPQSYVGAVRLGLDATVTVQELPGKLFHGRLTRTANALDAASRTLLVEVDMTNAQHLLLPGMYAQVHLHLTRQQPPVVLPANALIVRTSGAQAAVVERDSVVHIRTIAIDRDRGSTLEVDSGVPTGSLVVVNPPDNLRNGQRVRPQMQPQGGAAGGASPGGRPANAPKEGGKDSANAKNKSQRDSS